jgi:hypothetical protein
MINRHGLERTRGNWEHYARQIHAEH